MAGKRILSIGRLKRQKNFPLLIEAFARLPPALDAGLAIVGEGEERQALEQLVRAKGLEGRVHLPGFSPTPGDWYASADLFVLASDYEGFGNVVVEAFHFGVPVVATEMVPEMAPLNFSAKPVPVALPLSAPV